MNLQKQQEPFSHTFHFLFFLFLVFLSITIFKNHSRNEQIDARTYRVNIVPKIVAPLENEESNISSELTPEIKIDFPTTNELNSSPNADEHLKKSKKLQEFLKSVAPLNSIHPQTIQIQKTVHKQHGVNCKKCWLPDVNAPKVNISFSYKPVELPKNHKGWLIIVFTDIHYMNITKFWYTRLKKIGYTNFRIYAVDNLAYEELKKEVEIDKLKNGQIGMTEGAAEFDKNDVYNSFIYN